MQYYTGDSNVVDDQCKCQMSHAFDMSVIFEFLIAFFATQLGGKTVILL